MKVQPVTSTPISTRNAQFPGLTEKDQILAEARCRITRGIGFWQENFDQSELDRTFLAGKQWPDEIQQERENDRRPMLTINRLPQFTNRVNNDMMQNPTAIKVRPVEANKKSIEQEFKSYAGTKDYSQADVLSALIKNIEYECDAQSHYERVSNQMVEGAIGWLRVYTKYATEDVFEVNMVIDSVLNPTSAMIDHLARKPDFSDAMWGVVYEKMPRIEFEERYPDAKVGDLSVDGFDNHAWWYDDNTVTIVEYMSLEPDEYMLYQMSNGEVWDSRDLGAEIQKGEGDDGNDFIKNEGNLLVRRQRLVNGYKCIWRKITAWDILEGGVKGVRMPFSTIPLVPMLGKEIVVEGRRIYKSLIRDARDPQREYNYWRTAATEMVSLAPKAPWLVTPQMIENFEDDWDNANRKNYAYLPYNPDPLTGSKPERNIPTNNPAAEMMQAMQAEESMKACMGIYDASLGNVSNEESGRAILARERQSDIGTYHFTKHRNEAIARVGKLLVEGVQKVYDSERIVRLRFPNDSEDFVNINHEVRLNNGESMIYNDITLGKYDVFVTAGPSYNTQRVEAVNTLMEFIQAVPSAGAVTMDIIAKNMDWPGAEELENRLKKMLPPGIVDDEENPQPEPPPTPELLLEQEKNKGKQLDLAKQEAQNQEKALELQSQMTPETEEKVKQMIIQAMAELAVAA